LPLGIKEPQVTNPKPKTVFKDLGKALPREILNTTIAFWRKKAGNAKRRLEGNLSNGG